MAITSISTNGRKAILDALLGLCDVGSGSNRGDIRFTTAGGTQTGLLDESQSQPTQIPMFNIPASDTFAGLNGLPLWDDSCDGGLTTLAEFRDRDDNVVFKCSVSATGGGGDIVFNSNNWTATDPVELTNFYVSMPAS